MHITELFERLELSVPYEAEVHVVPEDCSFDTTGILTASAEGVFVKVKEDEKDKVAGIPLVISGIRGEGRQKVFALNFFTEITKETDKGYAVETGTCQLFSIGMIPPIKKTMMIIGSEYRYGDYVVDEKLCTGCNNCVKVCPTNAIRVYLDMHRPRMVPSYTGYNENYKPKDPEETKRLKESLKEKKEKFEFMQNTRLPEAFGLAAEQESPTGKPVYIINQQCSKCGECIRSCNFGAIEVK